MRLINRMGCEYGMFCLFSVNCFENVNSNDRAPRYGSWCFMYNE